MGGMTKGGRKGETRETSEDGGEQGGEGGGKSPECLQVQGYAVSQRAARQDITFDVPSNMSGRMCALKRMAHT